MAVYVRAVEAEIDFFHYKSAQAGLDIDAMITLKSIGARASFNPDSGCLDIYWFPEQTDDYYGDAQRVRVAPDNYLVTEWSGLTDDRRVYVLNPEQFNDHFIVEDSKVFYRHGRLAEAVFVEDIITHEALQLIESAKQELAINEHGQVRVGSYVIRGNNWLVKLNNKIVPYTDSDFKRAFRPWEQWLSEDNNDSR